MQEVPSVNSGIRGLFLLAVEIDTEVLIALIALIPEPRSICWPGNGRPCTLDSGQVLRPSWAQNLSCAPRSKRGQGGIIACEVGRASKLCSSPLLLASSLSRLCLLLLESPADILRRKRKVSCSFNGECFRGTAFCSFSFSPCTPSVSGLSSLLGLRADFHLNASDRCRRGMHRGMHTSFIM